MTKDSSIWESPISSDQTAAANRLAQRSSVAVEGPGVMNADPNAPDDPKKRETIINIAKLIGTALVGAWTTSSLGAIALGAERSAAGVQSTERGPFTKDELTFDENGANLLTTDGVQDILMKLRLSPLRMKNFVEKAAQGKIKGYDTSLNMMTARTQIPLVLRIPDKDGWKVPEKVNSIHMYSIELKTDDREAVISELYDKKIPIEHEVRVHDLPLEERLFDITVYERTIQLSDKLLSGEQGVDEAKDKIFKFFQQNGILFGSKLLNIDSKQIAMRCIVTQNLGVIAGLPPYSRQTYEFEMRYEGKTPDGSPHAIAESFYLDHRLSFKPIIGGDKKPTLILASDEWVTATGRGREKVLTPMMATTFLNEAGLLRSSKATPKNQPF